MLLGLKPGHTCDTIPHLLSVYFLTDTTVNYVGTTLKGMKKMGLVDAWKGEWEPTFGTLDANGDPDEWLMTHRADLKTEKELDYVFFSGATLKSKSVEKCPEPNRNAGWQQVSDHAGVMVTFEVPC
jgi:hypothetical protein